MNTPGFFMISFSTISALTFAVADAVNDNERAGDPVGDDPRGRRRDELQIQVALGISLVQMRGYRAPDVERTSRPSAATAAVCCACPR